MTDPLNRSNAAAVLASVLASLDTAQAEIDAGGPTGDGFDPDDPLAFTPVPSATNRHDGWTPDRQRQFIEALAVMGTVARALRAVGMTDASAYKLRRRPDAVSFAQAWDIALEMGRGRAYDIAMDRALYGYTVTRITRRGDLMDIRHPHDAGMVMAALRPKRAASPRNAGRFGGKFGK